MIGGGTGPGLLGGAVRVALLAGAIVVVGSGIVAAGSPARGIVAPDTNDILGRVPHDVDPATFPSITVEQGVVDWNHEIAGPGVREIVLTLAENLELERQALRRADPEILEAVDHGDRLDEMRARLEEAEATGSRRSSSGTRSTTSTSPFSSRSAGRTASASASSPGAP